jgi:hypothetical protein
VKVLRVDRIEKSCGGLSREPDGHRRRGSDRPARDAGYVACRIAAGGKIESARPAIGGARRGADFDDAARLEPEFRRDVSGQHVYRIDHRGIRRDAEQPVEPFVHWNPVDHVQQPVVDAADVKQTVVLGRPTWSRRDRILETAAPQPGGRAANGLARERHARRRRHRLELVAPDDDLLGRNGRDAQVDVHGERGRHGDLLNDRKEWRSIGSQRVGARRDLAQPEVALFGRD